LFQFITTSPPSIYSSNGKTQID